MADQGVDEQHEAAAEAAPAPSRGRRRRRGDGEEDVVGGAVHHGLGQRHHRGGVADPEVGGGGEDEGEADGHADQDDGEEHAEGEVDRGRRPTSGRSSCPGQDGEQQGGGERERHQQGADAVLEPEPFDGVERQEGGAGR